MHSAFPGPGRDPGFGLFSPFSKVPAIALLSSHPNCGAMRFARIIRCRGAYEVTSQGEGMRFRAALLSLVLATPAAFAQQDPSVGCMQSLREQPRFEAIKAD